MPKEHKREPENRLKCPKCDFLGQDWEVAAAHYRETDHAGARCGECNKMLFFKESVQTHKKKFGHLQFQGTPMNGYKFPRQDRDFKCPTCDFHGTSWVQMLSHLEKTSHSGGKCAACGLILITNKSQAKHFKETGHPDFIGSLVTYRKFKRDARKRGGGNLEDIRQRFKRIEPDITLDTLKSQSHQKRKSPNGANDLDLDAIASTGDEIKPLITTNTQITKHTPSNTNALLTNTSSSSTSSKHVKLATPSNMKSSDAENITNCKTSATPNGLSSASEPNSSASSSKGRVFESSVEPLLQPRCPKAVPPSKSIPDGYSVWPPSCDWPNFRGRPFPHHRYPRSQGKGIHIPPAVKNKRLPPAVKDERPPKKRKQLERGKQSYNPKDPRDFSARTSPYWNFRCDVCEKMFYKWKKCVQHFEEAGHEIFPDVRKCRIADSEKRKHMIVPDISFG